LIALFPRLPSAPGDYVSIWALGKDRWWPIGNKNVPDEWRGMVQFNHLISYRGHLLVGTGGYPPGNASIWDLVGGQWVQIAGHGVMGSWEGELIESRGLTYEYRYRMAEHEGDLFAGFGDYPDMAQVWRFSPAENE